MLSPDDVIAGRYRLVRLIASGGMGVVWQGWDERLRRTVAIKLLHPPDAAPGHAAHAGQRALREARITARLHHPNAVAVFDVVEHGGLPCLIMEYLPSITLAGEIEAHGPLRVPRVIEIGRQIAGALAAAHNAGIVHRDVKPANILLTETDRAKITDFGISHALGDVMLTSTGLITGTPAYLAPEVARGQESDALSDVFSLGGTLYAAVEGQPPYGGDANPMALLHRIASSRPLTPHNAGALTTLLDDMLNTERTARPSMRQVEEALGMLSGPHAPIAVERTAAITKAIPHRGPFAQAPTRTEPDLRGQVVAPASSAPRLVAPAAQPPRETWPAEPPGRIGGDSGIHASGPWVLRAASAAVALVLLIAGLVFWLGLRNPDDPGPQGAALDESTSQPAGDASDSTPTQSTGSTPSTPPTLRASDPATTPPTDQPSPPPSAETTTNGGQPQGIVGPAQTIRDYYAVMPAGTATGWTMLTADYQRNHAGGLQSYRDFWGQIRTVSVADIRETGPAAVTATITYDYFDGRRYVEVTQFTVVTEGGTTKIASSAVL